MASRPLPALQLPWSMSSEDKSFKKILITLLLVYVSIALPIILIKLPELTREEKAQLPPQLARIILEKQELPAKLVEQPKLEIHKDDKQPVSDKKHGDEKKLRNAPMAAPSIAHKPVAQNSTQQSVDSVKDAAVAAARERASNSGLMQFKDDLAEMRETLQTSTVETAVAGPATAGTGNTVVEMDRSMITSGATKGSGGINAASYSRDTGGAVLAERATTKVKSGLAEAAKKSTGVATNGGGNSDGAGGAARSEEEVRKVMEQHKAAIFNIYNKALREDATLQGKVVVRIVIDPNGRVLEATVVSSELNAPEVEAKLLQRIKLISFSASNVIRTTLNYAFDFLPQ